MKTTLEFKRKDFMAFLHNSFELLLDTFIKTKNFDKKVYQLEQLAYLYEIALNIETTDFDSSSLLTVVGISPKFEKQLINFYQTNHAEYTEEYPYLSKYLNLQKTINRLEKYKKLKNTSFPPIE